MIHSNSRRRVDSAHELHANSHDGAACLVRKHDHTGLARWRERNECGIAGNRAVFEDELRSVWTVAHSPAQPDAVVWSRRMIRPMHRWQERGERLPDLAKFKVQIAHH